MRFGFFSKQIKEQVRLKQNIWLHAVSVGEVNVIEGFISQLKRRYPSCQMIVTVTTKTGLSLARERLKDKALVLPSPLDFSFVAGVFLDLINPEIYVAAETEIWPNLYRQLYLRRIPFIVINGRISDASFGRYRAIRFFLKGILNQVSMWCMQSTGDLNKILELGAEPSRVAMTGNLKFDDSFLGENISLAGHVVRKDELLWVAGSTHPGEEEIVLDVYSKIIKDNPQWRLVIAPRHIERVPQILALINHRSLKALTYSSISHLKEKDFSKAIIVVDTIGELRSLYSLASLVFVGKSLRVGGGHNIIEPAYYGKAIIIGPRVQNFRDIVGAFKTKEAIVQVEDEFDFEKAVLNLCSNASRREHLGRAAKQVVTANQGATERTLAILSQLKRQRHPGLPIKTFGGKLREEYILDVIKGKKKDLLSFLITALLSPFSIIYYICLLIHRGFCRMKGTYKAPKPVISVGNITVGGTGKTPIVIWLAEILIKNGFRPVVLSRGYMPQGAKKSDEVDMLHEQMPSLPVLMGPNRVVNIIQSKGVLPADIYIADDGFQHWPLGRDLDIVAIDANNPFGNGFILPAGILREPLSALKRAQVIVLTKMDKIGNSQDLILQLHQINPLALVVESRYLSGAPVDVFHSGKGLGCDLKDKNVVGFCGIGDPLAFELTLKDSQAKIVKMFNFMDHHVFNKEDIIQMVKYCRENGVNILVTTHKDAVKLRGFKEIFTGILLVYLPIQLEIAKGSDEFIQQVISICRH